MARRRSTGDYILSLLSGGISGYTQGSQMSQAMNSKAALEEKKAEAKAREKKQDNLFKVYSDINRDPDERQEAKNRYYIETGDILPTPRAKPEKIEAPKPPKVDKGPSALDQARTELLKRQAGQVGKAKPGTKPKAPDPLATTKKNLSDLVDQFNKALVEDNLFPEDYERINAQYAPYAKILNDNGIPVPEDLEQLVQEAEATGEDPRNWLEKILGGENVLESVGIGGDKSEKIEQRKGADGNMYEKRDGKWFLAE